MDILEEKEKLLELIEKQKILIDVFFNYIPKEDKLSALADGAERIRKEVLLINPDRREDEV